MLVCVFLVAPLVIVVMASMNSGTYLTFPPEGFSFRWFTRFFTFGDLFRSFVLTLELAALTTLLATSMGTLTALGLVRRFRGNAFFNGFFLSPMIFPAILIGLSLFMFFRTWGLSQSLIGLVIAHTVVATPFVIRVIVSTLYGLDESLQEAARTLGASAFYAFFKVKLPQIKSGITAGAMFAFIVSAGQFDLSLFLSTFGLTPLPIALFNYLRLDFDPTPAAASTFSILLTITTMMLSNRLGGLRALAGLGTPAHK